MISINYILLVVIIPILLSAFLMIIKINVNLNQNKCSINLFIGIISARNNFDKRQSIRETWIQTINNISDYKFKSELGFCEIKLNAKFIIGDKECSIHPILRTNHYSCQLNTVINYNLNNSQLFLHNFNQTTKQINKIISYKKVFRGFSFVIRNSIIVNKIGVQKNFMNSYEKTTIVLLSAQNKDIILSKNISLNSSQFNEVYYESIEPLVLPKDFYGLLLIDNELLEFDARHESYELQSQYGFIEILRAYYGFSDYESIRYDINLIIGPTLAYSAADPEGIEKLINFQNDSQLEWNQQIIKINEKISNEILNYNDIILIDLIDIYRNLAEKVLLSLQSAMKFEKLTHYLKTDDDSYLNIVNILEELSKIIKLKRVWSGNFRRLWPLDYYGKWAEHDYGSPLYPPFACGSGYILSADLVEWLTNNINYLHRFQGEDVSMGIWLSAINPYYNDDKRWLCNKSEDNIRESFIVPQLDVNTIIKIHNFLINQ